MWRVRCSKVSPCSPSINNIEFDGVDWKPVKFEGAVLTESAPISAEPVPSGHGHEYSSTRIFTTGLFHFRRKQSFTAVCYHLQWAFGFGWGQKGTTPTSKLEGRRAIFLKQFFITNQDWRLYWGIMQRQIPVSNREEHRMFAALRKAKRRFKAMTFEEDHEILSHNRRDMDKLQVWLDEQYPDIKVNLKHMPHQLGSSYLFSGIFLQLVITVFLGALTRFKLGEASYAGWFLLWIYGGPFLRWKWFNDETLHQKPCLSAPTWLFFGISGVLTVAVAAGVCGGIAVICVNLMAAICNTTFTPSAGVWILIGVSIAAVFAIIGFGVTFFSKFAGECTILVFLTIVEFVEKCLSSSDD